MTKKKEDKTDGEAEDCVTLKYHKDLKFALSRLSYRCKSIREESTVPHTRTTVVSQLFLSLLSPRIQCTVLETSFGYLLLLCNFSLYSLRRKFRTACPGSFSLISRFKNMV